MCGSSPQALIDELKHTREACTAKVAKKCTRGHRLLRTQHRQTAWHPSHSFDRDWSGARQSLPSFRYCGHRRKSHRGLGTQFGKLAVAYELWGMGKPLEQCTVEDLLALYVKFHDEAEKDASLEERGQVAFKRLEEGDQNLRAFWEKVVAITLNELGVLYARLHVTFDHTQGESFYEQDGTRHRGGEKEKGLSPGEKGDDRRAVSRRERAPAGPSC